MARMYARRIGKSGKAVGHRLYMWKVDVIDMIRLQSEGVLHTNHGDYTSLEFVFD